MTRIAALAPADFAALQILRERGIAFDRDVVSADVLLVAPRSLTDLRDTLPRAKNVRWIHTLSAGVELLPFDELRKMSVVVTNSRVIYAEALGEWAIAAMLWFAKDLRRLVRNQAAKRWEPFAVERLEGKTAAIIGYGGIGQAIGRRAEAMGVRVLPVSRRKGDIDDVVGASDYVVLSTPLTTATQALMNAARIAKMRRDAVLINVSRGAVVDEAALIDALESGRIRGAALDVFETEPLPETSPLWSLENVLLSPHSADHTADAHEIAMKFFLENLARFERGETLENVVDLDAQY